MELNNWSPKNDDVFRRHLSVHHFDRETATDALRRTRADDRDIKTPSKDFTYQQETEKELMETVNKRYPDYCRTITVTGRKYNI
jgi:ribosomal protein S12 methylthiotransferase accessory factor YcaO